MFKVVIGSFAAAVAMFVVGFLFWATPLSGIAVRHQSDAAGIAVQSTLAQQLTASGTGTYMIPSPEGSAENTVLFGRGPVATVHFSASGFPVVSGSAMIGGFILEFVVALLIGAALMGIADRVTDFPSRARTACLFALAASGLIHIGEIVWFHIDLPYALYNFVVDTITLAVAGLVIARWFLPTPAAVRDTVPPV